MWGGLKLRLLKILFIAAEAFPLAKVGGLGDVVASLAIALEDSGHELSLILPKYGCIATLLENIPGEITISLMGRSEQATLRMSLLKGKIPVYLVENEYYFGGEEIYTQRDLERFLFFSLTIPGILSHLDLHPDIIHCHDWHTALVPLWLKEAGIRLPSILTIHNLAYQGSFKEHSSLCSGLSSLWRKYIPSGAPPPLFSFLSQGILLANLLTTVSPTYAKEILTPEYGEGLEGLLSYRRNELYGIINGIDYQEYNPATDPYLENNYDASSLEEKVQNKLALQRKAGLPQDPDVLLIGMVSRLDKQKGIDLLLEAIDPFITKTRAQLVILGQGREHYHNRLAKARQRYPHRLSFISARDESLARLIYGGSDAFLMPSRFEPCGLAQLIAMRYGAIPIVRHTGGLADTVRDVSEKGNSFVFQDYTAPEMLKAIKRAEESFYYREEWRKSMMRNMELDFSWNTSARKYEEVYWRAQHIFRSSYL